jgi:phenylpropionate dioxygenase-like ring-hydroxylating dioxygenase large terminal subunit
MTDRGWFAVARSADLVPRHVFQTALAGQEIALWRDSKGRANAWENRCPHRGVRLSIGANLGDELRCQYHGWRFAAGTGQCVAIPAHPGLAPSSRHRAVVYRCTERFGLVWVALAEESDDIPSLPGTEWLPLRAIFVEAPIALVGKKVTDRNQLRFFLQPVTLAQTMIHGVWMGSVGDPIALLRQQNDALTRLRDQIESEAA